ncbi:bifunctional diguanylate cyclase/phosphodiesterase [Candidatus Magnetomonas plexicatena]|uniref:bifunctional diguanylate cyclase/phosphodiesterase n=1 Tax=Candidatus Magnetomonas plexicatena TaxID=2552947 RepID=UPI001C765562|nr:EAL domain-containing protein [Nitrospirales bacterium LBB_01]
MESVEQFFRHNMDYVFLVYGFAFVFMGVAISVQAKTEGQFKLSGFIWILSAFAFLHGINEWLDMMSFVHPAHAILKTASLIFLVSSFCFLFEFSRRTLKICENAAMRKITQYLSWHLMPVILVTIFIIAYYSAEPLKTIHILSRYFLALPGAVATAVGLRLYSTETDLIENSKADKYFFFTVTFLIAYGFFAGFVAPKGGFFPASVINADTFLSTVHIPVQVFRAICALFIAFSMLGVIKLFNYEASEKLQEIIQQLRHKQADINHKVKVQDVINSILNISLHPISLREQLNEILHLLMSVSWISLKSKGCIYTFDKISETIKMSAHFNFTDEQLNVCSNLPLGKCLCGCAALKKEIVFSSSVGDENHTIRYSDMLPHGHYCVPIVSNDRLLGVINVYVDDGYERKTEDENFLKSVASTIAGIILRKESEEKTAQNYMIQNVINTIMQLSIQTLTLEEYLDRILELISTVPWLSPKKTGCIFLVEDNPNELVMTTQRGISWDLLKKCNRVTFGSCLCGIAALSGEVVFTSSIDDRHEVTYDGMVEHGHYCVPIKSEESVVGVINLYVEHGHIRTSLEENFLMSVANTLSGIIQRKRMEEKLEHMANYDALTGLPNRVLFFDRLRQEIKSAARYERTIGVLYIDIDNFKNVNDSMGHDVGDMLLQSIASRLEKCVRDTDTVCRMSGDEFTVILSNLKSDIDIEIVTQKTLSCLTEPYEINTNVYNITASVGVSLYPNDANDAEELLKHADTAMYYSKKSLKNTCTMFTLEMDESVNERIAMEKELRLALHRGELVVYYQPQLDIKTGKIMGAEALVRWRHPERGLPYPDKFIQLAEDTGLIMALGEQVLLDSCKQAVAWLNIGLPPIVLAVNVSTTQVSRHYDLAGAVFQILSTTQMAPANLELELTESFCMQNVDTTISMLRRFNACGVSVAIDDFGTGYSSLSYLKHLPFKKLKIDKSFIKEIASDTDDITIVRTIIDMSHNLKLRVIAEGVETLEQLKILSVLGCDEVQGFLFSQPIPAEEFPELLGKEFFCNVC